MRLVRTIIITGMLLLLVCGCGENQQKSSDNSSKSAQEYVEEYTNYKQLIQNLGKLDIAVADYSMGKNQTAYYRNEDYNPENPLITVYINPISNEELIDAYISDAQKIESLLMDNPRYCKYIKRNQPYLVTYMCWGNEIYNLKINGKTDYEKMRESITDAVAKYGPEVEAQAKEFISFLNSYDGIEKDSEGNFYYVVDSKNVSDSLDEIMKSIEEIRKMYPFDPDEMKHYNCSADYIGNFDETYKIYIDEYGNETIGGSGGLVSEDNAFYYSEYKIYNSVYEHFVQQGSYNDGTMAFVYYYTLEKNGDPWMCTLDFSGVNGNVKLSEEEILDGIYGAYSDICEAHKKHGITISSDLHINGSMALSEEDENLCLEVNAWVPMSEDCGKEEFVQILMENSRRYDESEYILPDDCE